jgi:ferredoxin
MELSAKAKDKLALSSAKFIAKEIKEFVHTSPANRLSFMNDYIIWEKPLVKFADGDDPIFTKYKAIIAPTHLTPREALAKAYNKSQEDLPTRLSIISWILTTSEETRRSNRAERHIPSRLWSHTLWYGEKFNNELRRHTVKILIANKYLATAPVLQPYYKVYENEKGRYSNWSERHIAYAAGQGTFSLSDGFITEHGIAHRCGSVVTNLILHLSHRIATGPYSNCLFFGGVKCQACINRCPAGAITVKGHDKIKCYQYQLNIGYDVAELKDDYDNDSSVVGCGLCQTKVPCEFQNPMMQLKKKA